MRLRAVDREASELDHASHLSANKVAENPVLAGPRRNGAERRHHDEVEDLREILPLPPAENSPPALDELPGVGAAREDERPPHLGDIHPLIQTADGNEGVLVP